MATRFYLPASGTAPLGSLAVDSGWTRSDSLDRRPCDVIKSDTSLTQKSATWQTTSNASWVWVQFQSKRLAAGYSWTTSDTVSMVIKVAEAAAQVDSHLSYCIRVVSGDGSTIRGTIGTYRTTSTEYPTSLGAIATRIHNARTDGASNFSSQAGDRIIIEIGHYGATPTANVAYHNYGDPSGTSDYALTADLTTNLCPWVELSRTVNFDLTTSKSAYIKGISTLQTDNQTIYMKGGVRANAAVYMKGGVRSQSQKSYIEGVLTVVRGSCYSYLEGTWKRSSVHVYLEGGLSRTSKSAFLEGGLNRTSKSVYIEGTWTRASRSAFIEGTWNRSSVYAYIEGALLRTSKSAYIRGADIDTTQVSAYINSIASTFVSAYSYIRGKTTGITSVSAYILSATIATTSKSAYIQGSGSYLIPNGDISKVGVWLDEEMHTTNIYQSIDETSADDGDFIYEISPQNNDYYECSLSDPIGDIGEGDIVVMWRGCNQTSGSFGTRVQLRQGSSTVIASRDQVLPSTPTTYEITLSSGEKALITDPNDLRIRFIVLR